MFAASQTVIMPFVKRFVEPRRVSGKQLEVKVWDELEAVQVNTLANLIRQLGSVISYAEEIMGEISETCTSFNVRVSSLRCRTKRLREEVLTELDAIEEGNYNYVSRFIIYDLSTSHWGADLTGYFIMLGTCHSETSFADHIAQLL